VAAEALEQSMLEAKDKDQLLAIAQALGIKTTARASKATLIDKILETTSSGTATAAPASGNGRSAPTGDSSRPAANGATQANEPAVATIRTAKPTPAPTAEPEVVYGPDGEPLADWEIELLKRGEIAPASEASPTAGVPTADKADKGDKDAQPADDLG